MKQAIRALSWAIYIFWIVLVFFVVTAVYSAFQFAPGFGSPRTTASNGGFTVSLPFYIDNRGFYDISDLQFSTLIRNGQGSLISNSSTVVPRIPRGSNVSATHTMSIDLNQMPPDILSSLLLSDDTFDVGFALKLNFAGAVPIGISGNFSMPWGAPISNPTIGSTSSQVYNATHDRATVPVSFENHSPINLDGTMRLELLDNDGRMVGYRTIDLNVPAETSFSSNVELIVPASSNIREAHLFFDTSAFNYGPVVIPIV